MHPDRGRSEWCSPEPLRDRQATRHPARGARCLDRVSRRGVSPDEDPGIARWEKSLRPRQGVALSSLPVECDTLAGSYIFLGILSRGHRHFVPRHAG